LSLYVTFIYVPLSFAYILPVMKWGTAITKEQRAIPWYKFGVMGALDGIAGVMQTFAVNYIPSGSLIILLTQAAIPISMVISRALLKVKYGIHNYVGALIVVAGLVVVLIPQFLTKQDENGQSNMVTGLWCACLILSCVPMTLSSVYKEKALGETEIDVVYMNGWVAVYQCIISLALAVPSAYASNITPGQLPQNMVDGAKCYVGISSVSEAHGKIHEDHCTMAPLYVNLYIGFNVLYNIFIIMILKYGSSNILWLAMTIMVPLGNFAFAMPFVPEHKALKPTDIVGLIVIMTGLVIYRFWSLFLTLYHKYIKKEKNGSTHSIQ